jgi:two-component system chemotaxis response regulator CheB
LKLTKDEEESVMSLAEQITGQKQKNPRRKAALLKNVQRRMKICKVKNLESYLKLVFHNPDEFNQVVLACTVKATRFFADLEQFELMLKLLVDSEKNSSPFVRVLIVACATGEEVYSMGLFLEKMRLVGQIAEYHLIGSDSDSKLLATANKGIFSVESLHEIPASFSTLILHGSGKTESYFTFDREVRNRIQWIHGDLLKIGGITRISGEKPYDIIACRHLLGDFDEVEAHSILEKLLLCLKPGGIFCLAPGEGFAFKNLPLLAQGRGVYILDKKTSVIQDQDRRVLIIEESKPIHSFPSRAFSRLGYVVEAVNSFAAATRAMKDFQLDLIILDLKLPQSDALSWLKHKRDLGINVPLVIISEFNAQEAEAYLGPMVDEVQDYISKKDLAEKLPDILEKLKLSSRVENLKIIDETDKNLPLEASRHVNFKKFHPQLIVIASSTGGTEALVSLLGQLPENCPPVMIVQHITLAFANSFFERLARVSALKPGVIKHDAAILPGHLYMALGDYHIGLKKVGDSLKLKLSSEPHLHGVRPSADILFSSVARAKVPSLGVILTGMGKDGAQGILELKHANCYTMAQDEDSCVVFGMPREAIERGAIHFVGNLKNLRAQIDKCILLPPKNRRSASF